MASCVEFDRDISRSRVSLNHRDCTGTLSLRPSIVAVLLDSTIEPGAELDVILKGPVSQSKRFRREAGETLSEVSVAVIMNAVAMA